MTFHLFDSLKLLKIYNFKFPYSEIKTVSMSGLDKWIHPSKV